MSSLHEVFAKAKGENRAALIGYVPAGFPTKAGAVECIAAMVAGGVDIVEVGLPYSDPVMDGLTIQAAVEVALAAGTKITDVMDTVNSVSELGVPTLVMSYWAPIERFGYEKFTELLRASNGIGVITPDLTPEEASGWISATDDHHLDRVFLAALSSTTERIGIVSSVTSGFVYAGAVMGVTGARDSLSDAVQTLVSRVRKATDLPVAVGLGVSTPEQAHDVAQYADGVIVGSAFINAINSGGPQAAGNLARELAQAMNR